LDSSFLASVLAGDELKSRESAEFLSKIINAGFEIFIPMIVLFETFHFIRRKSKLSRVIDYSHFQNIFFRSPFKYVPHSLKFFKFFKRFTFLSELKTSDAIIVSTALLKNSMLITWDKKILAAANNAYTPEEIGY
jgi:predicted nucleic acid-binding protein